MPLHATPYPHVMNSLAGPSAPKNTYLVFFSDVEDGQMWCPDCRRVDQLVKDTFDGDDKPKAIIYWVGKKVEWKNRPENHARVDWNVNEVPTILKIQDGKEVARLVDSEIDEGDKLKSFINDQ